MTSYTSQFKSILDDVGILDMGVLTRMENIVQTTNNVISLITNALKLVNATENTLNKLLADHTTARDAAIVTLDQRISAERAKNLLGWRPRALDILEALRLGRYEE